MRTALQIYEELKHRIQADITAFNGTLPEKYSIAWQGYLAGLVEWKVITFPFYCQLEKLLPEVTEPNPIVTIFSGREDNSNSEN
jgi:hypothetical protein